MRRFRRREDIDREIAGNSESMVGEVIGHATAASGEEFWRSGILKEIVAHKLSTNGVPGRLSSELDS
jgi:hypothetical protein